MKSRKAYRSLKRSSATRSACKRRKSVESSPWIRQRWRHLDNSFWVWLVSIAVLVVLVVNPILHLFTVSFQNGQTGDFTFANYITAYSRARYVHALLNSLLIGLGAATLCLLFGVPLAWALS